MDAFLSFEFFFHIVALSTYSDHILCEALSLQLHFTKPGINLINVLRTAFTLADPERVKRYTDDLTVFFTLSGSTSVKAERRMLMKFTLGFF